MLVNLWFEAFFTFSRVQYSAFLYNLGRKQQFRKVSSLRRCYFRLGHGEIVIFHITSWNIQDITLILNTSSFLSSFINLLLTHVLVFFNGGVIFSDGIFFYSEVIYFTGESWKTKLKSICGSTWIDWKFENLLDFKM